MNVLPFCITTSDETALKWLAVSINSFKRYNSQTPLIFCLDNSDTVKKYLNEHNIKGFKIIDYKIISNDYINKNRNKFYKLTINMVSLNVIFAFPEILDYIYKNYDYDVLFKFDTDTLFVSKVDFDTFYKSNKAYGGCWDKLWRIWRDTLKIKFEPIFKDMPLNSGLTMFRKSLQPSNMLERTIKTFEENDFKVLCYEQDAFNKIFENNKFDLNYQFGMNCNRNSVHVKSVFTAMHFCARDTNLNKLFNPFIPFKSSREIETKDNRYFAWTVPFYGMLKAELDFLNIENYIPYTKTRNIHRKLLTPKTAFYSSLVGNIEKYSNLAKVTLQSYDNTNTLNVDWIFLANTEKELEQVKTLMNNTYKHITLKFVIAPKTEGIEDYKLYNPFNWTTMDACKLFTDRIAVVDLLQPKYDILICVDLDIIFRDDISKYIKDFYCSPYKLAGQTEYNYTEGNLKYTLMKSTDNQFYKPKFYVNFGFGMIHCKNIHKNHWDTFLKISKGYERFFGCQEQLYFAISCGSKSIKRYDGLQMLVYNRVSNSRIREVEQYQCIGKTPIIHYTRSTFLTNLFSKRDILSFNTNFRWHLVTMLYYSIYLENVLKTPNLSEDFVNLVKTNAKQIENWLNVNNSKVVPLIAKGKIKMFLDMNMFNFYLKTII